MRVAFRLVGVVVCAVWLLPAAPVGSIKGYVKDRTGAVVPRAAVMLVNEETAVSQQTASDESGYFQFLQLPPARYQLSAEAAGFRKISVRDIAVAVDQIVSLDVELEIGQVTEVVEVRGGVVTLIEPEKSSTGLAFDPTLVKALPFGNRSFLDLARLTPGTVLQAPGSQAGGFSSAGMRTQSNHFLLDGIANMDPQVNGALNFRIADAVQEFSVITTAASAEFGRGSGAQVNIVTKSGANQFHGTGFWLHRNDALEATDFFTNKLGGAKNVLRRHQYGGTLGGPIRRDHTFFFYSWERFWQNNPSPTTAVVPTAGERATVTDPIARNLLAFWPLPTDPSAPAGRTNFVGNIPRGTFDNTHLARLDHAFGEGDRLSGRFTRVGGDTIGVGTLPNLGGNTNRPGSQSHVINHAHLFSPTFFTELRAGFSRNSTDFRVQDHDFNPATVFPGVPGVVDTARLGPENSGLPRVTVTGYAALGSATNLPQGRITTTYELIGNATKIRPFGFSRHTLKFGFTGRRDEARRFLNGNMRGSFTFRNFAEFAGACGACAGRSLVNSSVIRTGNTLGHWYRYAWYFYVQDDVKVSRSLTLNLGLRYEVPSAMVEKNNRATNFIEGLGPVLAGANRLLDLDLGKRGPDSLVYRQAPFTLPRAGSTTDRNNLAPVFGFAYTPRFGPGPLGDQKTVIRGGFRVAYDDIFNNIPVNQTLNAPWALTTTQRAGTTQPAAGYRWEAAFDQNVPLVARATQAPGAPAVGLITFNGYDNHARSAYAYNWNFGLQREIGGKSSVDISYLGSAGHKLGILVDANEPGVVVRNPGYRGTAAPNEQIFPFPQWGSASRGSFQGNSAYHGLVASWKTQYRNLLNLGGSYTLGHGIDNNSSFFGSDDDLGIANTRKRLDLERGNSGNDQRHRFISYWVLQAPVGRGRRFWSGVPAALNHLVGGWEVSGIVNSFTGQPFTVYANTVVDFSGFNTLNDRPDIMGSGPLKINRSDPDNFFDPAYFGKVGTTICPGYAADSAQRVTGGCAPAGRVGTSPRNAYYGPGLSSFDVSLQKRFSIYERLTLRYRADFFNIANHTNFGLRVGNRAMSSGEFGAMTSTSEHIYGGPRIIQMTLRLEF